MRLTRSRFCCPTFTLLFIFAWAASAAPATRTWDGGNVELTGDAWTAPANWDLNIAPANGDILNFAGNVRLTPFNNIGFFTVGGLTFVSGADASTILGIPFTTSGNIVNTDDSTQTINNALTLGVSQSWQSVAGPLTFGGPVDLGPSFNTLTLNARSSLNVNNAVSGAGNYTGNILFSDGFSPGNSPASVTLQNMTFDGTTLLAMELGGLTLGSEYDHLNITGTATLDGTLLVDLINGFTPGRGNVFDLFDGTLTGTFDSIVLPDLAPRLNWDTSHLYTTGELRVAGVPEPLTFLLLTLGLIALYGWRKRFA